MLIRKEIRFHLESLLFLESSLYFFYFIFLYFFHFHTFATLYFWNIHSFLSHGCPIFLDFSNSFIRFFLILFLRENYFIKVYDFKRVKITLVTLYLIQHCLFWIKEVNFHAIMYFRLFYKLSSTAHHIYIRSILIHCSIYFYSFFSQKRKLLSHLSQRHYL